MDTLILKKEMCSQMENNCILVLKKLETMKNVLLMGAPGTGKSKLMNDVATTFLNGMEVKKTPSHVPGGRIPIPANDSETEISKLSFIKKANRKVFRTTFHQNTKYRDFLTGIVPVLKSGVANNYTISEGILYRANEFAKQEDSAALLIIDEINRGPAIEVFGGSIVAIEPDKRLNIDGSVGSNTQFFEILDPKSCVMTEYAFSSNLYILAAMNQADASVAPLDVAFLRRWHTVRLQPDYDVLYRHFNVKSAQSVVEVPTTPEDIYNIAIKTLEKINSRIILGRGEEFQLGHGVFLTCDDGTQKDLDAALNYVLDVWMVIYSHIEELFFGDADAIAFIVGARSDKSPYKLKEVEFADEYKNILIKPEISTNNIYAVLYAVVGA